MYRYTLLSLMILTFIAAGTTIGFSACPANSEQYTKTVEGNVETVHCRCIRDYVRRGSECVSAKSLGVADPFCVREKGEELAVGMKECITKSHACLADADIDTHIEQCALALLANSAATAAALPVAPPVAYVTLGAALTSCGFEVRSTSRALVKCEDSMDDCRADKLNHHKEQVAACKH
jgi:hypothetical protein